MALIDAVTHKLAESDEEKQGAYMLYLECAPEISPRPPMAYEEYISRQLFVGLYGGRVIYACGAALWANGVAHRGPVTIAREFRGRGMHRAFVPVQIAALLKQGATAIEISGRKGDPGMAAFVERFSDSEGEYRLHSSISGVEDGITWEVWRREY